MTVQNDQQMALNEVVVDDADVEELLTEYMESKGDVSEAQKAHKVNKDRLEQLIEKEGWQPDQRIRIGPYIITLTKTEAKPVAFDRKEGRRVHVMREVESE